MSRPPAARPPAARPPAARQAAEQGGRRAEDAAARWLEGRGCLVLARRVRGPRGLGAGEIDLIVQDGPVLAVVEVKARPSVAAALEAVTPAQRRRLEQAAALWLADHPQHGAGGLRFDVVAVPADGPPLHLADAWRPEDAG